MPKIPSKQELAYEFRFKLASDLAVASTFLAKHPMLIDHPVFGDSESALHYFATENQLDIVKWLLSNGANPNGIANDDYPLHCAAQLGHLEVCHALLHGGADPDLKDSIGETALHKAASAGHLKIIELLLVSGANPSIEEMCGELPIDQALPRKRDKIQAIFDRHTKPQ